MRIDPSALYKQYKQAAKVGKETSVSDGKGLPKEGQVIKGQIVDSNQSGVKIKLSDGQVIQARLTADFQFSIGEQVSFVVKDATPEQLLLTPDLSAAEQMAGKLADILGGAGLKDTLENQAMLKMMVQSNLPIDAESLKAMIQLQKQHPEATMKQLVFMTKHSIPINSENISQMTMLENNEHALMKGIATLADNITGSKALASGEQQVLDTISGDGKAMAFLKEVNTLIGKLDQGGQLQVVTDGATHTANGAASGGAATDSAAVGSGEMQASTAPGTPGATTPNEAVSGTPTAPAEGTSALTGAENIAASSTEASAESLAGAPAQTSGAPMQASQTLLADSTVPVKDMMLAGDFEKISSVFKALTGSKMPENFTLNDLQAMVREGLMTHEQLRDFSEIIKEQSTYMTIAKGLLMTEQELDDVSELKSYFARLHEKVSSLTETASGLFDKESAVAKEAGNVKASVEYLNALNQDFNLLHLPLLLGDELLNSELYIMNDKKAMKDDKESITALVRLDLLNLGHTDIYVKKTAKNVDVKFYMTDEKQIDVMKEHVYKLHKMLNEKGFNTMGITVLPLTDAFDVTKDFLENDGSSKELKRYTFDMRA